TRSKKTQPRLTNCRPALTPCNNNGSKTPDSPRTLSVGYFFAYTFDQCWPFVNKPGVKLDQGSAGFQFFQCILRAVYPPYAYDRKSTPGLLRQVTDHFRSPLTQGFPTQPARFASQTAVAAQPFAGQCCIRGDHAGNACFLYDFHDIV